MRAPDRRHHRRWVPITTGWLCLLIGLADVIGVAIPGLHLHHRLHRITIFVPGTMTNVASTATVIIGLLLLMLSHGLRRRKRRSAGRSGDILAGDVCNAEVGDAPTLIAIDENVLRFQIAVQDSVGVGDDECGENLIDLQRNLRDLTRARPRDQARHASLFGELHRVPRQVAARIKVVNRNDRWMRQLRRESGLTPERPDRFVIARDCRIRGPANDAPSVAKDRDVVTVHSESQQEVIERDFCTQQWV